MHILQSTDKISSRKKGFQTWRSNWYSSVIFNIHKSKRDNQFSHTLALGEPIPDTFSLAFPSLTHLDFVETTLKCCIKSFSSLDPGADDLLELSLRDKVPSLWDFLKGQSQLLSSWISWIFSYLVWKMSLKPEKEDRLELQSTRWDHRS